VDFGTWESLDKFYSENKIGSSDDKIISIESSGNLVRKPAKKVLALIGIKDTVVIDTDDALLICPKKLSGKVKEITTVLKDKNLTDYL
jgi:mannose-1-phosphate guanylyltransferase